ncbi:Bug family tripartite tricarboxylate transporter substrate binding protein [Halomonas sp. HK25]|uniref:Bug family tripartite tricarboxylate transporter substrate binding protein n=1 Tax=Halomonas sp. HK25 TaxID=3394321 RepID=UPI0039FC2EA9
MKNHKSSAFGMALAVGLGFHSLVFAGDGTYPERPINLIVPTSAGGMTDGVARLYAEKMSSYLDQPVVVENRPGAASMLGTRYVVNADSDGYTLLVAANTAITMPLLQDVGYSVDDLVGVGEFGTAPSLLVVSSSSPYTTLEELVDAAEDDPGGISYATTGPGTTSHLTTEMFATSASVSFHQIPYRGISLAVPDVMTQRVDFMMGPATSTAELIRSGDMRALAITSNERSEDFPEVPTFHELGYPDASYTLFFGLLAPSGIPDAARNTLGEALEVTKNDEGFVARLNRLGLGLSDLRTPDQFSEFLIREGERYLEVIEKANIVIE